MSESTIVPAVNQIELHPRFTQAETRAYCDRHGIAIESWSPLGGSGGDLLNDKALQEVATRYSKSVAQVVIRWHLQHDFIVIPKSVHPERIEQNFDVFDFELSQQDMAIIDALNTDTRVGSDPRTANFM